MNNTTQNHTIGKRYFLKICTVAVSSLFLGKLFFSSPKNTTGEKMMLLTAEGKLVEVDKNKVKTTSTSKRASNTEIKNWMNEKKNKNGQL